MRYSDVKISNQVIKMAKCNGIKLTVTGYIYNPGIRAIKPTMSQDEYRDFMLFVATTIVATIFNAIDNQRYKGKWKPLSIKYYEYKKAHKLSLNIYEATGNMKKSIHVFKDHDYIAVGFNNRDLYPKSRAKINLIARYLEFGSRDNAHPPSRPLWRPITMYVRKNIKRYYKDYVREIHKTGKQYLFL